MINQFLIVNKPHKEAGLNEGDFIKYVGDYADGFMYQLQFDGTLLRYFDLSKNNFNEYFDEAKPNYLFFLPSHGSIIAQGIGTQPTTYTISFLNHQKKYILYVRPDGYYHDLDEGLYFDTQTEAIICAQDMELESRQEQRLKWPMHFTVKGAYPE